MGENKNLGVIVILLVLVVAGYQAITQVGNYVAEEILEIPMVGFWAVLFVGLFLFVIVVLGVKIGDITHHKWSI